MTGPEFEIAIVALACWRAGARAGTLGMLAVAHTLRNKGGHAYANALMLPEMAQGWDEDGHDLYPDPRDPDFLTLLHNVDVVLKGNTKDISGGGKNYVHAGQPLPPGAERTATWQGITFYK